MMLRFCLGCAILGLLLIGQPLVAHAQETPEQHESVSLPSELDRVLRDYEQGWRAGDAAGLASLFTPDGFILRPRNQPVRGRAAIESAYQNAGGNLQLRALEYAQSDSIGYIIGGYGYQAEGPDSGKFILTLRLLEDGKWYISADMDNSNR